MGRGTTPSSSRSLGIRPWPLVKRISIDYVRNIFSKRRLPLEKEYRLVWSERQLGQQLNSPSSVTHWFNIGVLSSPILSKLVSSSKCVRSSLSLSVLWLPQHKLRCLLLFAVPNTMPSYSQALQKICSTLVHCLCEKQKNDVGVSNLQKTNFTLCYFITFSSYIYIYCTQLP